MSVVAKKRGRPTGSQKIDLQAILKAAISEFAGKGFDGARLGSIAKEAQVANSVLSYHFEDKEDLWKQCIGLIAEKMMGRFIEMNSYIKDLKGLAALKVCTRQFVYFSAEFPEFYNIVIHEMCTRSHRARWLINTVLTPAQQLFLGDQIDILDGEATFMGYPLANLSSIIIGATNSYFVHAFQMSEVFDVDVFDKEEVERHADIIIDILFAKFEKAESDEN